MFIQNFRATQTLTKASFGYLANTYPDLVGEYCPSTIVTSSKKAGDKIKHVNVPLAEDEAEWIYDYILKNRPADPTGVCIMARTNNYIEKLWEKLQRISNEKPDNEKLRFFTASKDSKFFRRAIIKDIMAMLALTVNYTDAGNLRRICKAFIKGVGPVTIAEIEKQSTLGIDLGVMIDRDTHDRGDPYYSLIVAHENSNIVVYDTETTGLDITKDQIIQISAIKINACGEIIDTLDQMVIPTIEISKKAQETHHQTRESIIARGGIDTISALKKFSAFVDGCVIVGHNSDRFDSPLVQRQLGENGLPALNVLHEYDTMMMAKQFYPKLKNYKLSTLCEMFGVTNENAHDALGDIIATGKVLNKMIMRNVIPVCSERKIFIEKYAPLFQKFFVFCSNLRTDYLEKQDLVGLVNAIIDGCRITKLKKYQNDVNNQLSVADLVYAIRNTVYDDIRSFIRGFIDEAALSGSQMDILIKKLQKIPLITVHQSKGCEFETVLIAGTYSNNFPSYRAVQDGAESEEKRVFYVAISRAKERLIMITPTHTITQYDTVKRNVPCPYIDNIPDEYIENCIVRYERSENTIHALTYGYWN